MNIQGLIRMHDQAGLPLVRSDSDTIGKTKKETGVSLKKTRKKKFNKKLTKSSDFLLD